jgi:hypothetical protein
MKKNAVVKNYYVLPCCLLLLNLVNNVVNYKAELVGEPLLRPLLVMFLVLGGSSLVAYVVAPALATLVRSLHQTSLRNAGELGEGLFLLVLGGGVFWAYYMLCNHGVASLLPVSWRNP